MFPQEVISKILNYLEHIDIVNMIGVSKDFDKGIEYYARKLCKMSYKEELSMFLWMSKYGVITKMFKDALLNCNCKIIRILKDTHIDRCGSCKESWANCISNPCIKCSIYTCICGKSTCDDFKCDICSKNLCNMHVWSEKNHCYCVLHKTKNSYPWL